jgi:hypothetical protein
MNTTTKLLKDNFNEKYAEMQVNQLISVKRAIKPTISLLIPAMAADELVLPLNCTKKQF